jgi:hypothetical protein
MLLEAPQRSLPVRADTDELSGQVTAFAAGGESLYCVAEDGTVWELPEGWIEDGTFRGGMGAPRLVAPTVEQFLEELLAAVERFVEDGSIVEL